MISESATCKFKINKDAEVSLYRGAVTSLKSGKGQKGGMLRLSLLPLTYKGRIRSGEKILDLFSWVVDC